MSRFYVACDLGLEMGRVVLGTLNKDQLILSEIESFPNPPSQEKDALQWNIPYLYERILDGLRRVGTYEEPVESVSCTSWAGDYLLFDSDGSLLTPAFHHQDGRTDAGRKHVLASIPWETLYQETGWQRLPTNTIFQLAAESSKRLKRAGQVLPMADGFNYLLSGVARAEKSLACTTQLYNPITNVWSQTLASGLHLPAGVLPPVVAAGTELGPLRPEIVKDTRLEDTRVIATCSHSIAASLAGLPIRVREDWAFIHPGKTALLGTQLGAPLIGQASRELGFSNEIGYDGCVCVHKQTTGLSILDECQQSWKQADRAIDSELLSHLAGAVPPFESLIDPTDPRLSAPGDMPQKIQAYCKETGQVVPRKPGPIFRCILESLALLYRKSLQELELLTGARFAKLFILGKTEHPLLNHFIANAMKVPSVVVGENSRAIGNILVQALSLKHIDNFQAARDLVGRSVKTETIVPYANAWDAAYDRLAALSVES